MQSLGVVVRMDGRVGLGQKRAGVQALIHLHQGNASAGIAGFDGALYGCGATPAWQQRRVHVDATQPGQVQNGLGQNEAIGNHHD